MKIFKQLAIIFAINLTGEALSYFLRLPIPGSIIGMLLLLILLLSGLIKPKHIKEVADFLLGYMGFFFIPVGVGIMASYTYLKGYYIEAATVILLSTILVMGITAVVTEAIAKNKEAKDASFNR